MKHSQHFVLPLILNFINRLYCFLCFFSVYCAAWVHRIYRDLICDACVLVLLCPECIWGSACSSRVQGGRRQKVQIHLTSLQHVQSWLGLAHSTGHILRRCDGALQRVLHRWWWWPDPQHNCQWHCSGDTVHHRWVALLQKYAFCCITFSFNNNQNMFVAVFLFIRGRYRF